MSRIPDLVLGRTLKDGSTPKINMPSASVCTYPPKHPERAHQCENRPTEAIYISSPGICQQLPMMATVCGDCKKIVINWLDATTDKGVAYSCLPLAESVLFEWGLACPRCGCDDAIFIDMSTWASLSVDGTDPVGDHYWDEKSLCRCAHCDTRGAVIHFQVDPAQKTSNTLGETHA